jgi:hypothetical protein
MCDITVPRSMFEFRLLNIQIHWHFCFNVFVAVFCQYLIVNLNTPCVGSTVSFNRTFAWSWHLMPKLNLTLYYHSYSENLNNMQQCFNILLFLILNEAWHVSGNTPSIIRSLKLHTQSLVLHTWKVVARAVVGRSQVAYTQSGDVQQLHVRLPSTYAKPEAACAVLGSWWWAVCCPKHVELHLKYGIIKFLCIAASCWGFHCKNCTVMHGSTTHQVYITTFVVGGSHVGKYENPSDMCFIIFIMVFH